MFYLNVRGGEGPRAPAAAASDGDEGEGVAPAPAISPLSSARFAPEDCTATSARSGLWAGSVAAVSCPPAADASYIRTWRLASSGSNRRAKRGAIGNMPTPHATCTVVGGRYEPSCARA